MAAAVVAVLAGVAATLWATGVFKPSVAISTPSTIGPDRPGQPVPKGFAACGPMLCPAAPMADRSRDPALTRDWRRDAWPIPADAYTLLVHCLAGEPEGETPGAAFRAG